jgi:hypothetical protein
VADLSTSQYFVYADRNPTIQIIFLAFYDAAAQTVRLLGADFISSGKLRPGEDSFLTPVGVFENVPDNWGYRAQGTKNSKGWRGLGAHGSRVWDFGYQQARASSDRASTTARCACSCTPPTRTTVNRAWAARIPRVACVFRPQPTPSSIDAASWTATTKPWPEPKPTAICGCCAQTGT